MKNDEREHIDRRVNDQWARRMRALEREFERADRARQPKPDRHSIPLAVLSAAVVLLTAVLILTMTKGSPAKPAAKPAPLGPFGTTPAAQWHEPLQSITLARAVRVGAFSAKNIGDALTEVRDYLVVARATEKALAPGNTLAAPVRGEGTITYQHRAKTAHSPEELVVSVNAIWAYALQADYPLAPGPGSVVGLHERAEFRFAVGATAAKVATASRKDTLLWFDDDCGFRSAGLVGLPRASDPDALPGYSNGVSADQAFDLRTATEISGHICR